MFKLKIKMFFILVFSIFFIGIQFASANTSFTFSVPEGQGAGNNEFYHGRCVRVDVLLDTDGHNTGGADLEINYDPARINIVNNDCSTPATTIYHDSQYQNYVNNHVVPGTGKITLGAYNNAGTVYNGSGRFAYFYFSVLDGAGNYELDFEATPGVTTDSNLAEAGTGNDILEDAFSYTLVFADDNDTPYVSNENPAGGASGVQVISSIAYRLNDDDAGVDFNTLTQSLTGANWGVTNYTSASPQISHSCSTTNANRVPNCNTTLNPSKSLYYCENYTVNISVSDLGNPTVHTLNNHNYNFDTEPDNDATEVYNKNPANGTVNVQTNSNITFSLRDLANPGGYSGTGVDIGTLSVTVSASGWGTQTYTTVSPELTATPVDTNDYGNVYDYNVSINPAVDFPENTIVTVTIDVDDYGCPAINHQHDTYTFTTADTVGPVCTLFTPNKNVVNMATTDNVTFHCTDDGVGVDVSTVSAIVDGVEYKSTGAHQFTYSGTSADYFFTVNPVTDFSLDYALEVIVNAQDFSGNHSDQVSFGLATGTAGGGGGGGGGSSCPICKKCETCKTCEDTVTTITNTITKTKTEYLTKYKQCQIIKKIDNAKLVPIKTKNPNTLLKSIILKKINNTDTQKDLLVTVTDNKIIFEGNALPNNMITLMIESEPVIVTGLANKDGKWKIEMANIFIDGIHKVSAVVLSEDKNILDTKPLVDFKVERKKIILWWYWLVIVLLLVIIFIFYKKYKKYKKIAKEK